MVVRWIQTRNIGLKQSAPSDAPGGHGHIFDDTAENHGAGAAARRFHMLWHTM